MEIVTRIGTHSGAFHADDAMGCMMLSKYTKKWFGSEIVRTRDTKLLDSLEIVIDVGQIYDPKLERYDHHQKGFNETFNSDSVIKLSAAGLIYKHYGKEVIGNAIDKMFKAKELPENIKTHLNKNAIKTIWHKLYGSLFVTLDAIDNGIERYPKDVKPLYHYYKTDLASRVGRLNPNWWDEDTKLECRFSQAMDLCEEEFLSSLKSKIMGEIASIPIVEEGFENGLKGNGQILVLPKSCFWKEALFTVEKVRKIIGQIKYVIYVDRFSGTYRVQAVPVELNSFISRLPLKEEWRGKNNKELAEICGVDDAVFCHHSGFIGGAKSLDGTLRMAEMSLEVQ